VVNVGLVMEQGFNYVEALIGAAENLTPKATA
jgi:hypothetical protein